MGLLYVCLKVTMMHLAQLVWAGPGLSSAQPAIVVGAGAPILSGPVILLEEG